MTRLVCTSETATKACSSSARHGTGCRRRAACASSSLDRRAYGVRRPWLVGAGVATAVTLAACTNSVESTSRGGSAGTAGEASDAELAALVESHFDVDPDSYEDVRAVLITVDGRLVVERYSDSSAEATHNVASVTKSVTSLLVGIALDEGHLGSVEQTLDELLPDYAASMPADVAAVTLQELLTMTAGLPYVDDLPPRALLEGDPVARIVSGPLITPPGEVFTYSSVGSHLLSAILSEATGRGTLEYAQDTLFDPIGIETEPAAQPLLTDFPEKLPDYEAARFAWPVDGQGRHLGFCCLKLSATDMLTLGQLMLAGGRWNGEQVVPTDWITESTRRHIDTAGLNAAPSYGYQWWVTTADGHAAYAALGFGGQVLAVVPEMDLVMVVATDIPDVPRVHQAAFLAFLDQVFVPALRPS